ncbi:MAG: O-methyltransferase [Candidatus Dormibacteria bacterium]
MRDRLAKTQHALQERRFVATVFRHVAPHLLRTMLRPSARDLLDLGGVFHGSGHSAIRTILGDSFDEASQAQHDAEYAALESDLTERYSFQDNLKTHAREYSVEHETGMLLYSLLRSLKPKVVLETGVANGHSTFLALSALAANGSGSLYSTDIDPNCGLLLKESERRLWNFRPLRRHRIRVEFAALLAELPTIDFFFHDSEHSYAWQMHEFASVWRALSAGGVLASDDVDTSYAFIDFCHQVGASPTILFDRRKFTGLILRHPGGR